MAVRLVPVEGVRPRRVKIVVRPANRDILSANQLLKQFSTSFDGQCPVLHCEVIYFNWQLTVIALRLHSKYITAKRTMHLRNGVGLLLFSTVNRF